MKRFLIIGLCLGFGMISIVRSAVVVKNVKPQTFEKKAMTFKNGIRDPFVSPLIGLEPTDARLEQLMIDEVKLVGIIKLWNGEIYAIFRGKSPKLLLAQKGQKFYDGEIMNITLERVTFNKSPLH